MVITLNCLAPCTPISSHTNQSQNVSKGNVFESAVMFLLMPSSS